MNTTRTGKIARLPLTIRTQLNYLLREGVSGKDVVAWLNGLPEVAEIVEKLFSGHPIREQNLSEWKQGGYREWLAHEEAREALKGLEEETEEWDEASRPAVSDTLARWIAVRYAAEARSLDTLEGPERWRLLRELCGDVAELRRGDHRARRLAMDDSRLELEMERVALARRYGFQKWSNKLATSFQALMKIVGGNPEAQAALDELNRLTSNPYDAAVDEESSRMGVEQ